MGSQRDEVATRQRDSPVIVSSPKIKEMRKKKEGFTIS
jgi:hypothetical protein